MALTAASGSGQSYTQILKSTALIGGSSVVNIMFAIIRNKAMAVLLGPGGVGLMGLYNSIADLAQNLAGLGIQASGVRQIAESVGTGEADRIARTAIVLRRISIVLGLVGAALLAALSLPIAEFTFGDSQHTAGVLLLSVAIFFRLVSAGQIALIQGMRQIANLARINMFAALCSTVISIPMVYFFGEQGIVPSLVATAGITILTSWWYARKIRIEMPAMSLPQMSQETAALLKLGFVFMVSGFLTVGAAYAIRIIVLREDGVAAAGLYQAAWALGGLYAGFILQAMGTDFYPRLTAVAGNHAECNRLVNEQAQISMLLAGPGVVATLTLAPLVMRLLYSPEFYPAVDLLRWICLGMMLRLVAWPMGFIVLAKGAQKIYFWTEVAAAIVHVGLAWLLVTKLGFIGAGMAFFGLYVWHNILIYLIVRRLTDFRWSRENIKLSLIFLPSSALVFGAFQLLPLWQATTLGAAIVLVSGLYSLRMLLRLMPPESFPAALRPWLPKSA
ncbi:O-antigen translocase [Mesorhizobium sp. CGMCC 1.15528]|uniref:O-antigen translocase n=1 Tax=Mesorhizobium zhangyense TaxID=1776730 RepID=A0A7C9VE93_9HYPH|nr:O-antigen translocase [Mesorhizobium zhangyense]NGN43827.1 O-antigen translocase [Mesorhizobium zhangyense]